MSTWMQVIWIIEPINRRSQSVEVDAMFPGKAEPKLKNCFTFDGIAHFSREHVGRVSNQRYVGQADHRCNTLIELT